MDRKCLVADKLKIGQKMPGRVRFLRERRKGLP